MFLEDGYVKTETKADPFSLESLIAWLEKQPATKAYCYLSTGGCLLHQYFSAMSIDVDYVGGKSYNLKSSPTIWRPLGNAFADISVGFPRTFGAALDRARYFAS